LAGQPGLSAGAATAGAVPGDGRRDDAAAGPARGAPDDALATQLAAIWAMVADADPELAKRVPGYLAATD